MSCAIVLQTSPLNTTHMARYSRALLCSCKPHKPRLAFALLVRAACWEKGNLSPHTLIQYPQRERVCPNLLHASPSASYLEPKQPAELSRSSSTSNVFSAITPFDQGEGGERRASAPCTQVVRRDQGLQGGGAHQETRRATAVATATEVAQDAGSLRTSVPVAATEEAGCSDIVVPAAVLTS
jgi:hypothetical protein